MASTAVTTSWNRSTFEKQKAFLYSGCLLISLWISRESIFVGEGERVKFFFASLFLARVCLGLFLFQSLIKEKERKHGSAVEPQLASPPGSRVKVFEPAITKAGNWLGPQASTKLRYTICTALQLEPVRRAGMCSAQCQGCPGRAAASCRPPLPFPPPPLAF